MKRFLTDTNDQAMQQIISLGVPGTSMPVWGDRMAEAEIQAIVGFIRSWEPTAPEVAQPVHVPRAMVARQHFAGGSSTTAQRRCVYIGK